MAFPSKQKDIYARLLDDIERYRPGAKLPPEREYCRHLKIARETLRHALLRLEKEGRIIRSQAGTFIAAPKTGGKKYGMVALVGSKGGYQHDQVLDELNLMAKARGYQVIGITFEEELFRSKPGVLLNFPVDGFLFRVSSLREEQIDIMQQNHIPLVALNRMDTQIQQNHQFRLDWAECAIVAGYGLLLDQLIACGHRRIAFFDFNRTPEYRYFHRDLWNLFQEKLGKHFDKELFYIGGSSADWWRKYGEEYTNRYARQAADKLFNLAEPPTAVAAAYPLVAALKTHLTARGLQVPLDVSLMFAQTTGMSRNFGDFSGIWFNELVKLRWGLDRLLLHIENPKLEPATFLQEPLFIEGTSVGEGPFSHKQEILKGIVSNGA